MSSLADLEDRVRRLRWVPWLLLLLPFFWRERFQGAFVTVAVLLLLWHGAWAVFWALSGRKASSTSRNNPRLRMAYWLGQLDQNDTIPLRDARPPLLLAAGWIVTRPWVFWLGALLRSALVPEAGLVGIVIGALCWFAADVGVTLLAQSWHESQVYANPGKEVEEPAAEPVTEPFAVGVE